MVKLKRETGETFIELELELAGTGNYQIDTGIGFFNHMLELWSKHGFFDLELKVDGDTSTTVPFRDKENQLHNLNSDELIEMGEQVSSFMQNHYDSSWNIKADIEAAATFDELNSINITNNDKWPQ